MASVSTGKRDGNHLERVPDGSKLEDILSLSSPRSGVLVVTPHEYDPSSQVGLINLIAKLDGKLKSDNGFKHLIFDLSEIAFLQDPVLGKILETRKALPGVSIGIVGANKGMSKSFDIKRVGTIISLRPNLELALSAMPPSSSDSGVDIRSLETYLQLTIDEARASEALRKEKPSDTPSLASATITREEAFKISKVGKVSVIEIEVPNLSDKLGIELGLKGVLLEGLATGPVVVDLSKVTSIGDQSIGQLIAAHTNGKGAISFYGIGGQVKSKMDMFRLQTVLKIAANQDDAIGRVSTR